MAPADPLGGDLAAAFPERPRRHSLPEPELVSELEETVRSGSTLGAIDRLQAELELRASEAKAYREWETRMRGIGTPDAIVAVERVREEFSDVVPQPEVAGPPRRILPERRVVPERLTAPRMVLFAPSVSAVAGPPPPTYDESNEIVFDRPTESAAPVAPAALPQGGPTPESGLEPPSDSSRIGRASRLFWLWFAGNASLLSVVVGAALFSLGMSLRQSIVATVVGVVVSAIPIAVGTLAARLTGQPTMVVSRAVFGMLGNAVPASIALASRIFWGAVLLWILSGAVARILVVSGLAAGEAQLTVATLVVAILAAGALAFIGYSTIARLQLVVTVLSAALVVGFIALTASRIDVRVALTVGDGPWILVLSGAVIVFSVFGLLWAGAASDLGRYQRSRSSRTSAVSWAAAGAALPALILVSYGALLASSDPATAGAFLANPVDAIAALLPAWYPVPLIAAVGLGLLSSVTVTVYSGGFALQALVPRIDRRVALGLTTVAVAVVATALAVTVLDFGPIIRDVATTIAVPVAAWTGVFGSSLLLRRGGVDARSLLVRDGRHQDFDLLNLGLLVFATAVGFGLTTASVGWLGWQGYLFGLSGVPLDGDLASSDVGVFVALALGLVAPLLTIGDGARTREEAGDRGLERDVEREPERAVGREADGPAPVPQQDGALGVPARKGVGPAR